MGTTVRYEYLRISIHGDGHNFILEVMGRVSTIFEIHSVFAELEFNHLLDELNLLKQTHHEKKGLAQYEVVSPGHEEADRAEIGVLNVAGSIGFDTVSNMGNPKHISTSMLCRRREDDKKTTEKTTRREDDGEDDKTRRRPRRQEDDGEDDKTRRRPRRQEDDGEDDKTRKREDDGEDKKTTEKTRKREDDGKDKKTTEKTTVKTTKREDDGEDKKTTEKTSKVTK